MMLLVTNGSVVSKLYFENPHSREKHCVNLETIRHVFVASQTLIDLTNYYITETLIDKLDIFFFSSETRRA